MPADFTFPGHRLDPKALRRLKRAILFAYGNTPNSRNMECHWYAVWDRVLADLIADTSRLIPVPQFVVWYIEPDPTDEGGSQPSGGGEEAGNTTIDSITTFASTIPEKSALELVPDFAIVRTMLRRTAQSAKLKYTGVPLLVEVKRLPMRFADWDDPTYLEKIDQQVIVAESHVMEQATYLFRNYPRQQSAIVIACSGLWWRCRIVHKTDIQDPDLFVPRIDDDDEEDKGDAEEDGTDDSDEGETSDDELDLIGTPEALAHGESEEAIPENKFSTTLQLGTRGSDQRFGLIHKRLLQVLDNPYRTTGEMG